MSRPEKLGFSRERLGKLDAFLQTRYVEPGRIGPSDNSRRE